MQLEFHPRDKNLTWITWALTSLPALLYTCKPVYLHYMDSSPFQDSKTVFTYTDGNQQEEHNGSPHLQGSPYREASLPRRNSLLYQLQIHCNIPIKKKEQLLSLWAGMEKKTYKRQASIILITNKQGLKGRRSKDHSQFPREALSLEKVLCSPSLTSQWRTAQVKSHVYKVNLKAHKHVAAQIWCLWTHSGTLNVVPRLSRRVFTSLSTLIIRRTIVLALSLHQDSKNQVTKADFCFGFPAHYKKLQETLTENKQNHHFNSSKTLHKHSCYWRRFMPQ